LKLLLFFLPERAQLDAFLVVQASKEQGVCFGEASMEYGLISPWKAPGGLGQTSW
jgi:hypothetical protein